MFRISRIVQLINSLRQDLIINYKSFTEINKESFWNFLYVNSYNICIPFNFLNLSYNLDSVINLGQVWWYANWSEIYGSEVWGSDQNLADRIFEYDDWLPNIDWTHVRPDLAILHSCSFDWDTFSSPGRFILPISL
jgi:hypothetical protein